MDMGAAVVQSGFMGWFAEYGQVVYIFAQMAFWLLVGLAAVFAAAKYSQYVDFMTGKPSKKREAAADSSDEA